MGFYPYWRLSGGEFLMILAITGIILLLTRPIALWYWKLNEIAEYQRKQLLCLRQIATVLTSIKEEDTAAKDAKAHDDEQTVLHLD